MVFIKERYPDYQKVCTDYAGCCGTYPAFYALACPWICRDSGLHAVYHFLRFNPAAIYLFKRISISKGSLSAMRSNFFTKNDGIVPVHFLYCRLCGLLHHLYHWSFDYPQFRHYECSHVLPDVFSHLCIDQYLSSNTV